MLRATHLAGHRDAGRNVRQTHGAVGLVDMLAPGARRAIGIGADICRIDVDDDGVVDHRINPHRGETGVALGGGVERRDADQPVHAPFGLQPAVGVGALDLQRCGLDARLFAAGFLKEVDGHAMLLGPARVHAQQHAGPVTGLGAAGAGVDLDEGVIAVGLTGQQRLKLGASSTILQRPKLAARLFQAGLIAFIVGHFGIAERIGQITLHRTHRLDLAGQPGAFAHQRLGGLRLVPERRILDAGVQLIKFSERRVPVKDAS